MELQFLSFPSLFSFLLFMFAVLKLVKRSKTNDSTPNLPLGPWKLPLIGNMHQLIGSPPHEALRDLAKKYGPLMHLRLGEVSTIVVSSPETAKEMMKTHDIIFAARPPIIATRIISYDSTNISFSPYGLPINLTKKTFSSTYGTTSRAAFGKKCKDQETFISIVKEAIKLSAGFNVADVFPSVKWLHVISGVRPKLEKLHQIADRILENIINEHKEGKATTKTDMGEAYKDFVDVLLKFQERGDLEFPLTNNNIKAVLLDIFAAGSETSSTAVDWAMAEMLKNPSVMEKAQAEVRQVFDSIGKVDETDIHELKYLKLVIKETLRLHPSAPLLLPREFGETCEINGYDIPVKTKVIVNGWAVGRDPKYWTKPDSFYPERFLDGSINYKGTNFEYIPFGAGRRICPSIMFGVVNIELPLAQLLYHYDWKLQDGMQQEDVDMNEAFGATVRRKKDPCLIPIACHSLPVECS